MSAKDIEAKLNESLKFLSSDITQTPAIVFILGSGLASFADHIKVKKIWTFTEIPHFAQATVEGHPGKVIYGTIDGIPVIAQQGRLHAYEGLSTSEVIFPVRLWAKLGVKNLLVTNAAGGLTPKMRPGDFMIIKDQINLTGSNPLSGENIKSLGPRFVDMTEPFSKNLSKILAASLTACKARFSQGVYVGVLGPSFETAAEIKFFQKIGGGAVGMSTVFEVLAARHASINVVGLSCITNLGTGLSKTKLSHDDVKNVAGKVEKKFAQALIHFMRSLKVKNLI